MKTIKWTPRGKAEFATFNSGRVVFGEAMIGHLADGWVAGARSLGDLGITLGYYSEKSATARFATRGEAIESALKLAESVVAKDFERQLYLHELDKKSPWKNPQPPSSPKPIEWETC